VNYLTRFKPTSAIPAMTPSRGSASAPDAIVASAAIEATLITFFQSVAEVGLIGICDPSKNARRWRGSAKPRDSGSAIGHMNFLMADSANNNTAPGGTPKYIVCRLGA
jgi:hypothetical protein